MSDTDVTIPAFDPTTTDFYGRPDYQSVLTMLRDEAPVHRVGDGLVTVARYEDIREVSREPRRFRSGAGAMVHDPIRSGTMRDTAPSILFVDPPEHAQQRGLVNRKFTPRAVSGMEARVRELAATVFDRLPADAEPIDVVDHLTAPFPLMVIAELLGIPASDRHLLRPWSQAIVKMYEYDRTPEHEAQAKTAGAEFAAYVSRLAVARRASPGDDLVSHLALVEDGGERLSERELVATCVLLLNAGHEASVNAFGNGLVALFRQPGELARLQADPWGLSHTAVEEFLRFDSPLHLFERTAKQPTVVGGVELGAGEKIAALLGSANRDPLAFDRPGVMDVGRDPNPHLGFGSGIHFCLGAPLARLELQISLPLLVERFPRLALDGDPELRRTFVLRGYESVPVRLS